MPLNTCILIYSSWDSITQMSYYLSVCGLHKGLFEDRDDPIFGSLINTTLSLILQTGLLPCWRRPARFLDSAWRSRWWRVPPRPPSCSPPCSWSQGLWSWTSCRRTSQSGTTRTSSRRASPWTPAARRGGAHRRWVHDEWDVPHEELASDTQFLLIGRQIRPTGVEASGGGILTSQKTFLASVS